MKRCSTAPAAKLANLENALRGRPAAAPTTLKLPDTPPANTGNLGLYVMIAAYVGLYYAFSDHST